MKHPCSLKDTAPGPRRAYLTCQHGGVLALFLTILLEAPWWVLGLRVFGTGHRHAVTWWQAVSIAVGVNLLTHPVVWRVTATRDLSVWIAAELVAIVVEFVIIGILLRVIRASHPWVTAALLSLGANATTALVGVLFF